MIKEPSYNEGVQRKRAVCNIENLHNRETPRLFLRQAAVETITIPGITFPGATITRTFIPETPTPVFTLSRFFLY
ncbi:hypothetical protein AX774_g2124 [Zancudomyces culisetae]|uniref:Uncharacterized protein n=1 Tax=Zancudomyces culisetae TaxID=1213189 RepID=A0A1R1PTU1_ZANCU|nr:hypothetical protein AX774_g2124 [Zancudomyces culisetae]|eukprot:OMH84367.1 hypothetical protein AX774_g2124 [Zancudomyces culisetae]